MKFDDLLNKAFKEAYLRKLKSEGRELPTPQTMRQPSTNESQREWKPAQYGLLFCVHNKSYYEPCKACRRDKKECQLRFDLDIKRHNVNVQNLNIKD
jgi:hypothetical protein